MTKEEREKHERLLVASLRQGGHLMRELREIRKDSAQHFKDDAKFQLEQVDRVAANEREMVGVKKEVVWLKRACVFLAGLVGIKLFGG